MTNKNPMKKRGGKLKYGLGEIETPTFNVKDVEKFLLDTSSNGKLSDDQKNTITNIRNLDKDGDGEISLLEILSLESDLDKSKKAVKNLRKIMCALVLFFVAFLGALFSMAIAAQEVTKESRVTGGAAVAKNF